MVPESDPSLLASAVVPARETVAIGVATIGALPDAGAVAPVAQPQRA